MTSRAAEALKIERDGQLNYERGMGWTGIPYWDGHEGCVASSAFQALFDDGSIVHDDGSSRYGPRFVVVTGKATRVAVLTELFDYVVEADADPTSDGTFADSVVAVRAALAQTK